MVNVGCVKWFNNKSGYGFLRVISEGDNKDRDIFVHHSGVVVKENIFKYLVQGEYVEFDISKTKTGEHEFQAEGVRGIGGGDLMCETREKNKVASKGVKKD